MTEQQAHAVAEALGAHPWQSGGGIWLVRRRRADGCTVLISDESVCEYPTDEALDRAQPSNALLLV
jgi:hypothetical protein